MFTGFVEDIGRIDRADRRGEAVELVIAPDAMRCEELALGESVAVDGVCLTVTARTAKQFHVLAGPETLSLTTTGALRPASRVNLERALRVGDRLGGHMVAGHVDAIGEIAVKRPRGPAIDFTFRAPREVLRYVVVKGSIAIDGISLTVNGVDDYTFSVSIIPHTLSHTTLGDKSVGGKVNLETDLVGKYVEKLVSERRSS